MIYKSTLYVITKVPTETPSRFAKITAITSMPSIAPSKRIARPLPIPDTNPPNNAHKSKSFPANGDARLTSIGNTSVMSHAIKE